MDFAILGLGARFLAVLPLLAEALGSGFTVHFINQARVTGVTGLRRKPSDESEQKYRKLCKIRSSQHY